LALVYFIEKEADINALDLRRSSPLHWACYQSSEQVISYILALGGEVQVKDELGMTPLHLAVKNA